MDSTENQLSSLTALYKKDFGITKILKKKVNSLKGDQTSCQEAFFNYK